MQRDGKIVVAGVAFAAHKSDFALVRYNTDGSLDRTFNRTGKVTTTIGGGAGANSATMQSDGKIVVAGHSSTDRKYEFALVRYNPDGTLDTSFNGTGKVTTGIGGREDEGYCVALQTDGKILVAGNSINSSREYEFALVRYNTDGSLDTSFNRTGTLTTVIGDGGAAAHSAIVQNDGKIVVAGSAWVGNTNFALVRYNADGSLYTTFHGTGKVTTAIGSSHNLGYIGSSVALQSDGKILVTGYSFNKGRDYFALVCYNGNGDLDTKGQQHGKADRRHRPRSKRPAK